MAIEKQADVVPFDREKIQRTEGRLDGWLRRLEWQHGGWLRGLDGWWR